MWAEFDRNVSLFRVFTLGTVANLKTFPDRIINAFIMAAFCFVIIRHNLATLHNIAEGGLTTLQTDPRLVLGTLQEISLVGWGLMAAILIPPCFGLLVNQVVIHQLICEQPVTVLAAYPRVLFRISSLLLTSLGQMFMLGLLAVLFALVQTLFAELNLAHTWVLLGLSLLSSIAFPVLYNNYCHVHRHIIVQDMSPLAALREAPKLIHKQILFSITAYHLIFCLQTVVAFVVASLVLAHLLPPLLLHSPEYLHQPLTLFLCAFLLCQAVGGLGGYLVALFYTLINRKHQA